MFDLSFGSPNTSFPLNINTFDSKSLGISLNSFPISIDNNFVSTESDQTPLLQQAIDLVTKTLTSTAESDYYDMVTGLAFGTDYNQSISNSIKQSFLAGDFSQLPNVQIISAGTLGNADAAYATELNTIFLSDEFINSSNQQEIAGALLEEIGHYIDDQINIIDFAGDEGEVFSRLVQGDNLDAGELAMLRQEDDHGVINFNKQQIDVEFKNFNGNSSANTIKGTKNADFISGLGGNDNLQGLAGNDTLDGGTGNDTMIGGPGDDYYFVSESRDSIKEVAKKGGKDTVSASISYKLPNNVENLILTGSTATKATGNNQANQLTGNDVDNILIGLNGKDKLFGLGGNDSFDGGVGSDCLDGGAGNDTLLGYGSSNKEIDTLIGGIGSDTFLLGSDSSVYYNKNGDLDYAVIKDFDPASDKIELKVLSDVATDSAKAFGYNLVTNNGNTELRAENDELIVVIQGVTGLTLLQGQGSSFSFIGGDLPVPTPEPIVPTPEPIVPTPEPIVPTPEPIVPTPGSREIADSLWDAGKTMGEIGAELKNRGFDLPKIADAVNNGITKNDGNKVSSTELATALLNSGYPLDARQLADLLWDELLDTKEIGKAMAGNSFSLEDIADALNEGIIKGDGNTLRYVTGTSPQLLDSGYVKVADNTYRLDVGYASVAEGLWNSGYAGLDTNKLADLLWDEGANGEKIGQAFNYLDLGLKAIADGIAEGVTKSDGTLVDVKELTTALWNSGYSLNTRQLADLMSRSTQIHFISRGEPTYSGYYQIGAEILSLGFDMNTVADAICNGIFKANNYVDASEILGWFGGGPTEIAKLLRNAGADVEQTTYAISIKVGPGTAAELIKDIIKNDSSNLNWTDIAIAFWKANFSYFTVKDNSYRTADFLYDQGASLTDIAESLKNIKIKEENNREISLEEITNALKFGITKNDGTNPNYSEIAVALKNSGYGFTLGKLADLLWDLSATPEQIVGAMYSAGFSLGDIASAVKFGITKNDGTTLNYNDTALALFNSGYYVDKNQLADLLWDIGANPIEIGQAMKNVGFTLESIADAMRYGVTKGDGNKLNYSSIADGLWHSGHQFDGRKLADLLWDRGADEIQIGRVLKDLNFSAYWIFDAVKNGVTTKTKGLWGAKDYDSPASSTNAALAVINSNAPFSWGEMADWIWDAGKNTPEAIGWNLQYLGLSLKSIAEALKGVTKSDGTALNYIEVATALKKSGHNPDAMILAYLVWNGKYNIDNVGQLADFLSDQGFDLKTVARSLYQLEISTKETGANEIIGRALLDITPKKPSYYEIAGAIKQAGGNPSPDRLAIIAMSTGAPKNEVIDILRGLGGYNGVKPEDALFRSTLGVLTLNPKEIQTPNNNAYLKYEQLRLKKEIFDPLYAWVKANNPWLAQQIDNASDKVNKAGDSIAKTADDVADNAREHYNDYKKEIEETVNQVATVATAVVKQTFQETVGVLRRIPVVSTVVGIIGAVVAAINGDAKGIVKEAINAVLGYSGASNLITSNMVNFAVDILWALYENDHKGAISATLENLKVEKKTAELFTKVVWSTVDGGDWRTLISSALETAGFKNADDFGKVAWSVIDNNYEQAITTGLQVLGPNNLGIDQVKADTFVKVAKAVRDNNTNQAADALIALKPEIINSTWVKDLKDTNANNDRDAINKGLSDLGFSNTTKWVDAIWAVKDGQYINALSAVASLGDFPEVKSWLKIIENLQNKDNLNALKIAFDLAGYEDGESLIDAAVAVKGERYMDAFAEAINLTDGGRHLADAFKYLMDEDYKKFVISLGKAAPAIVDFFR